MHERQVKEDSYRTYLREYLAAHNAIEADADPPYASLVALALANNLTPLTRDEFDEQVARYLYTGGVKSGASRS